MEYIVGRRHDMVVGCAVVMNCEGRSSNMGLYIARSWALGGNGEARAARKSGMNSGAH
jgi:hypothetical protein